MTNHREQLEIDALIQRFFAAFDNRDGRVPSLEPLLELFAEKAVIAKHYEGGCDLYSPQEFAQPRIALLRDGDLTGFHEWEETASTEIIGGLAIRASRYAKAGLYHGADYAGNGIKFFQLAKLAVGWRIVALSWTDLA